MVAFLSCFIQINNKHIKTFKCSLEKENFSNLNVSNLSSSIYILQLTTGNQVSNSKFIKQ